jgi:hypothetical protein
LVGSGVWVGESLAAAAISGRPNAAATASHKPSGQKFSVMRDFYLDT